MDNRSSFVVIQEWMLDLDLDLIETVIFAVIWGFSQDGESRFRGSWKYLQNSAKCSRAKVSRTIKRLVELGYIKKNDQTVGGVKVCEYYIAGGGIPERRGVSQRDGGWSLGETGGSIPERPNNEDTIVSSYSKNKECSAPARARESFDFKNALRKMGVSEQHASDWMAVRKAKRMTNTRTAFDRLKANIERACKQYNVMPDDCVAFAASRDWGGFDSSWEAIKDITKSNTTNEDDRVRRAYAAEEAKFKGNLHF